MAAAAISDKVDGVIDSKRVVEVTFTPSTSYLTATPSENTTLAALGLKQVDFISLPTTRLNDASRVTTAADTKRGFSVTLAGTVGSTVNLRLWETSGTEVADAVDKSASPFRVRFHGS